MFPIEKFSLPAKAVGSINVYPDMDGVIRKIPLVFQDREESYYHMALVLAMDYRGISVARVEGQVLSLEGAEHNIKIPFDEGKEILINWRGKWAETYKHFSFLEVINAYATVQQGGKPLLDLAYFKDSICLIGVTGLGLHDIRATPLEPEYPAMGVVANVTDSILNGDFIRKAPPWLLTALVYLFALLPCLVAQGEKPLREGVLILVFAII